MRRISTPQLFISFFLFFYLLIFLIELMSVESTIRYETLEWMISFEQSIRRGLIGTILINITTFTKLDPVYTILFLNILVLIVFIYNLKKIIPNKIDKIFIFSPFVLGFIFISGIWLRKDLLLFLGFIYLIQSVSKNKKFLTSILIFLFSLFHEMFLFISFPIVIINYLKTKNIEFLKTSLISFLSFVLLILFLKVDKITFSEWNNVLTTFNYELISHEDGPFNYIGNGFIENLNFIYESISVNNIYQVLFFIFWIFMSINSMQNRIQRMNFISSLAIFTLFVSPLFILGIDYGRWFYLIILCSIIQSALYPINFLNFRFSKIIMKEKNKNIIYALSPIIPFVMVSFSSLAYFMYQSVFGRIGYFILKEVSYKDAVKELINSFI